ncbi:hypothetical protein [Fischerella sp. PCC 9605]|uniref:hypothetical protein n=1 Tax=Fischerella sp. PCC 9605 TaxID=1173024 RepID=UPI0004BBD4F0|nr:hypothetical protein [Fischerella sp. PCC 9605]
MKFKELVDIFNALLTPVIAVTTIYIAWQQYQVSQLSLKKDLYEKRLRVFQVFMSYLSEIVREGKVSYNRCLQFLADASEAEFLFDEEITNQAKNLYNKGIELWHLSNQLYPFDGSPGLPTGEERSRVAHKQSELLAWFSNQVSETRKMFRREMSIQEQKRPSIIKLVRKHLSSS